jgi:hypothetical protein
MSLLLDIRVAEQAAQSPQTGGRQGDLACFEGGILQPGWTVTYTLPVFIGNMAILESKI